MPCRWWRLRRSPAVSMRTKERSPRWKIVSIASLVVPGVSETITRSWPRIAFSRLDFPTFGRPRIATPIASSLTASRPVPGSLATIASRRSPVPWPCTAETGTGSPSPSRWNSSASASWDGSSILLASSNTGLRATRRSAASSSSPGVTPARASVTNRTRSASATAARACSTTERVIGEGSSMSTPPVSISRNCLPFHSQTSSFRSRVTPGVSWTTACREAVRRLTSVDFPTFGKPTTATVPASVAGGSGRESGTDKLFDPLHDVVDAELRGIEKLRVGRGLHPCGIALVAKPQVGGEGVRTDARTLSDPAARALLGVGDEVHLHLGVRRDDGSDVPPLDDRVALVRELPLPIPHDRSDRGMAGHGGDDLVHPRFPDLLGDVVARDPHLGVLVEGHRIAARQLLELRLVFERNLPLQREPGQSAVHRACVHVAEAEPLRQPLRDGALACPCRPVYGNDHRLVTESRRSKSPGKLIAAASAPPTSTPSRETSPATAPRIAIRWSPPESTRPPFGRAGTPRTRKPSSVADARPPRARSELATVSIRSVSFSRSSRAPRTRLSPRAPAAARAKRGSSSMRRGTSSGSMSVAVSSDDSTSMSPTGSRPRRRRLKTAMRAPMRVSTSRSPVRVGLMPTPWTVSCEPGSSVAATISGAAAEKSPGTSTRS